jgi:hypothetical protein
MKSALMAAVALVSLFTASPALARDGAAARERTSPKSERENARPAEKAANATRVHEGRACCIVSGGKVIDHLRG